MVDIEVFRTSDDTKLYTFRFTNSILINVVKDAEATFFYRRVSPEYTDNTNVDTRLKIQAVIIDSDGAVASGYGSLDDQIYRLGQIQTNEHGDGSSDPPLYIKVYWSGEADYTTYYGAFLAINAEISDYNSFGSATAEFQVASSYWRN